jgi:hypothetical protein
MLISGGLVTDVLGLSSAALLVAWQWWRGAPLRQTRRA